MFEKQEEDVEFDPGTFVAMVEKVVVSRMGDSRGVGFRFVLRNSQEIRISDRQIECIYSKNKKIE